jgi:integrase
MTVSTMFDAAGRRRSPATMPGYHAGRPPRNKGLRYPADPPTVDEIVAVMRHAAKDRHGWRLRAVIVVLWRAGLRVQEALAVTEHDLDARRGSILVRHGKGGRRREVGMDEWGWEELGPWLSARAELPVGPLFCIIDGQTRGRPWSGAAVRSEFRRIAARAGVRRRFAPHQLRHAHALELAREGRAAEHHPAPARARQPRHHIDLPPGHRPGGDHHGRAHAPRADDVRYRRAPALKEPGQRERHRALPLRPGEATAGPALVQTIVARPWQASGRTYRGRLCSRERESGAGHVCRPSGPSRSLGARCRRLSGVAGP